MISIKDSRLNISDTLKTNIYWWARQCDADDQTVRRYLSEFTYSDDDTTDDMCTVDVILDYLSYLHHEHGNDKATRWVSLFVYAGECLDFHDLLNVETEN